MQLKNNWFTEFHADRGTAFSLEINEKLHEEQSPYQKIEIYDTRQFGKLMVIDDCTMVSTRDNFFYHEMMSHPALYSHPAPKRVVIIGGGDCGTLQAVLQHEEVEQVWQIDIDERVTRLSEKYFPELCTANTDPRASLMFDDGIKWIQQADPASVDVIIIDSTDPVGPAEGLFSGRFYKDCYQALAENGILVQQSESPLLHMDIIKDMHTRMRSAGFSHSQTLTFPQCIYPSGWWSCTLAGKHNTLDEIRIDDIQNRPFDTRYYNLEIHQAALALPEFMKKELHKS